MPPFAKMSPTSMDLGYHTMLGGDSSGDGGGTSSPFASLEEPVQNWFEALPDDVVVRVMSFLPCSASVRRCARVCRRFYFLTQDPSLWREIRVTKDIRDADFACQMLSSRVPRNVERVVLNGCSHLSDSGLSHIVSKCRQVKQVQIRGCQKISEQMVCDLMTKCSNIEHLDVTGKTVFASEKSIYMSCKKTELLILVMKM